VSKESEMSHPNLNFERTTITERHPPADAPVASDVEVTKIPVLGKTLLFRGELTAEEDVILQGRVEGSIRHASNLIIGTDGSVLGDVYARHLTVEGLVEGDLHCSEAAIVRTTAQVRGNIFAPRVGIMEGATFNGRVEMESAPGGQAGLSDGPRPNLKQSGGAGRPSVQTPGPGRQGANAPRTPLSASTPDASSPSVLSEAAVDRTLNPQSTNKK
jgi:cytoskeletal protein CcmA (bactofilin family)